VDTTQTTLPHECSNMLWKQYKTAYLYAPNQQVPLVVDLAGVVDVVAGVVVAVDGVVVLTGVVAGVGVVGVGLIAALVPGVDQCEHLCECHNL
jgi:hypothetical protein